MRRYYLGARGGRVSSRRNPSMRGVLVRKALVILAALIMVAAFVVFFAMFRLPAGA